MTKNYKELHHPFPIALLNLSNSTIIQTHKLCFEKYNSYVILKYIFINIHVIVCNCIKYN